MNKGLLFILFVSFFYSCKGQDIKNDTISNHDDFSNSSKVQDYNAYLNYLSNKKNIEAIKVLYNGKIYEFREFKETIGFNSKSKVDIIKDLNLISKYKVKGCKVLFIINKE